MNRHGDYRASLKEELLQRIQKNPSYSLRSFARDIGLSPGRLCDILNKKSGLSGAKAGEIARNLALDAREKEWFVTAVEASDSRMRKNRELALEKLRGLAKNQHRYYQLNLDQFKLISDWAHLALLDLTLTKQFKKDTDWISKRLGVSRLEVEMTLQRLLKLGLLKIVNGNWQIHGGTLTTPGDTPSEAIKKFHKQILEKAILALGEQGVSDRDFSCITFPMSKSLMPEAKKRIQDFRRRFNRWALENKLEKEEVYTLGIYLFQLTREAK